MAKLPKIQVSNMVSNSGNPIANQFEIETPEGRFFQSYDTVIAFISNDGKVTLNNEWAHSNTTSKYRALFLGEDTKTTRKKVESGEYELADLN